MVALETTWSGSWKAWLLTSRCSRSAAIGHPDDAPGLKWFYHMRLRSQIIGRTQERKNGFT